MGSRMVDRSPTQARTGPRRSFPRLTVRRLMIAVAIVGGLLGIIVGMEQAENRERLRQTAAYKSREAADYKRLANDLQRDARRLSGEDHDDGDKAREIATWYAAYSTYKDREAAFYEKLVKEGRSEEIPLPPTLEAERDRLELAEDQLDARYSRSRYPRHCHRPL